MVSSRGRRILPTQTVRPDPFASRHGQKMGRDLAHLAGSRSGAMYPVRRSYFLIWPTCPRRVLARSRQGGDCFLPPAAVSRAGACVSPAHHYKNVSPTITRCHHNNEYHARASSSYQWRRPWRWASSRRIAGQQWGGKRAAAPARPLCFATRLW
jgi:hypothetical protein